MHQKTGFRIVGMRAALFDLLQRPGHPQCLFIEEVTRNALRGFLSECTMGMGMMVRSALYVLRP